jgi:hypothetical protein
VNGKKLPESGTPVKIDPGWWWDRVHRRAYFNIPHERAEMNIEIKQQ